MIRVKLTRTGLEDADVYLAAAPPIGSEIWIKFETWKVTRIVFYTIHQTVVVHAEKVSEGA